MKILMLLLKLLTSLVLALLPLSVLIRDWRFHDKRTRLHHNITRTILAVWFVGSLAAVAFVWHETYRSSQLDAKVDELVDGKNKLLHKIETYQTDLIEKQKTIEGLEEKAKLAARGITAVYYFEGTILRRDGPNARRDDHLVPSFDKMVTLQNEKKFTELSLLSEELIEKYPEWPTPHAFLGVASENLGNTAKAIQEYQYFLDNASSEPSYRYGKARTQIRQLLNKLNKDG